VALNAVANHRILKESSFRNLFIQPAAGDNGLALGAAYYGWLEVLKKDKAMHDGSTRFGRSYSALAIDAALSRFTSRVRVNIAKDIVNETADHLASGEVIGWFQGRSEFGPRALGGRSILADPRSPTLRDHINAKIKFREDFRPFAPSVPIEEANTYFECNFASPYMLLVAKIRAEWLRFMPSVVHVDQTARIQTVRRSDDPLYHSLLLAMKQRTGISVLLNTSFNKRAMPIVETPEQAIDFFLSYGLDLLVLGDHLVYKNPVVNGVSATASILFQRFGEILERKRTLALLLNVKYQFNIAAMQPWTIDLSKEGPRVEQGPAQKPDVTVECQERDLNAFIEIPATI
jgi:carbamoyltransferase